MVQSPERSDHDDSLEAGEENLRVPTVEEARLRQQAIGYRLRQIFDDVVSEPVPDEFLDILKQADSAARK